MHEGRKIIISGERRVRAYRLLDKEEIDGKCVEGDLLTLALMENILRSDLTAIELAESVAALKKQKDCSNDDIAEMIGKKKSTTSEILKLASLPEDIRNDARTKPYMTRERLLKVARRKDPEVQRKAYGKLCATIEKQGKELQKLSEKSQGSKKVGNRYVNSQIRKVEKMTAELKASHEKMLSKIKDGLTDEEKKRLVTTLENMRKAIGDICNQYYQSLTAEQHENVINVPQVSSPHE